MKGKNEQLPVNGIVSCKILKIWPLRADFFHVTAGEVAHATPSTGEHVQKMLLGDRLPSYAASLYKLSLRAQGDQHVQCRMSLKERIVKKRRTQVVYHSGGL